MIMDSPNNGFAEEEFDFEDKYVFVKQIGKKLIFAHTTYHEVEEPDYDQFVTEDDTPVDNIFSEKQQRLLIDPLHANQWTDRMFLASSNVAIYYEVLKPAVVPDMFLSFDVKAPEEWFEKKNRSYFLWRFGKPPEVVVEVISNKKGGEASEKMNIYAHIGVLYYILIDPYFEIYKKRLNVFKLTQGKYEPYEDENFYMPEVELGIMLWEGLFEGEKAPWGRWCSKIGNVLQTGAEKTVELSKKLELEKEIALFEKQRAEEERLRAEEAENVASQEKNRAEEEKQRAEEAEKMIELERKKVEKLMQQLKALGLKPDEE